MSVKMSVVRSTVQGEQIVFDILQCNAVTGEREYDSIADMHQAMEDALTFADMRVYEMRQRGIEGYALRQYCTPQEWQKVQDILDFMAGRQDLDLIQRRWQSQQEEQSALEEGRLAAMQEQEVQEVLGNSHASPYGVV